MYSTFVFAALATYALATRPAQNQGNNGQFGNQPGFPGQGPQNPFGNQFGNQYPFNGQQQGSNGNQYPFGSQNQYPYGQQFGNGNGMIGQQGGRLNWECLFQNQRSTTRNPLVLPGQQTCTTRSQCPARQMCCSQTPIPTQQTQQPPRPVMPRPAPQQVLGRCQIACPVGARQL